MNKSLSSLSIFGLFVLLAGCTEPGMSPNAQVNALGTVPGETAGVIANPMFVPIADPQAVSEMTADVIDDYFKIEKEVPVHVIGNTITEGTIKTFPEVSPTILEPWRRDTASFDQLVDNTLQTYRRWAMVRMLPGENGYFIDVAVFLELEDLPRPEHSSAGASTFRYDTSFDRVENPINKDVPPKDWIRKGRDCVLEQRILAHLQSRAAELRGK
jgi:hypothetical protein